MPDMQTALRSALTKTLQAWDDDEVAPPPPSAQPVSTPSPLTSNQNQTMTNNFNVTNNVSRETFNYIKDNPGSTRMEIIIALGHKGFGKASVSSLIAQMRRCNMVHDTNGLWYADIEEYRPIKNYAYAKKKNKEQKKPAGMTGLGALLKAKIQEPRDDAMDSAAYAMNSNAPAPKRMVTLVRTKTPADILKDLTVYQAYDLYKELKQIFGG
jgi:hypothetical protein